MDGLGGWGQWGPPSSLMDSLCFCLWFCLRWGKVHIPETTTNYDMYTFVTSICMYMVHSGAIIYIYV